MTKPYIRITNEAVEPGARGYWLRLYTAQPTSRGSVTTSGGDSTTYCGVRYKSLRGFLGAWALQPVRLVEVTPNGNGWDEGADVPLAELGVAA